jgi:hypothetical protein
MSFDLNLNSDNLIEAILTDGITGAYINDATLAMSLFKLAARKTVQVLTPNVVATAGTWTLTFEGATTAAIQWNATLAEIQGALEALSVVSAGDVSVGGATINTATTGLCFEWAESFTDVSPLTFNLASLTGPTNALSTMVKKTKNAFKGAAVNKGAGKVGLPVVTHDAISGDHIRIEGTINYDGTYTVDATTSANEIVVTAAYVAETFTGLEEIYIGISGGTELTLSYVAASNGLYRGILPDTLKGLAEYEELDTSLGSVYAGVYWLFVTSVSGAYQRMDRIECHAVHPDGS